MNNEELPGHLEYWQKELKLPHWDITARMVRCHEMPRGTRQVGAIHWQENHLIAAIKILIEEDYEPTSIVPYDAEKTLVHELLHLLTFKFCPEVDDDNEEVALNVIAAALVRLRRNGRGKAIFEQN